MAATAESQETASLADFLQILRVRRALIALILSLVVVTTAAVTAFLPRWYLATTKIRVDLFLAGFRGRGGRRRG